MSLLNDIFADYGDELLCLMPAQESVLFDGDLQGFYGGGGFLYAQESYIVCHPSEYAGLFDNWRSNYSNSSDGVTGAYPTTNPLVVDCFPADAIIVVGREQWASLDTHPDWPEWQDEMTTGELWTFIDAEWPEVTNEHRPRRHHRLRPRHRRRDVLSALYRRRSD